MGNLVCLHNVNLWAAAERSDDGGALNIHLSWIYKVSGASLRRLAGANQSGHAVFGLSH